MKRVMMAGVVAGLLAGCVGGDDGLRRLESGSGPDEFAVQPARPLALPDQLILPAPGGANRADVDPQANAIAALGGSAGAQSAGGVPARDGALVTYVSRNGVPEDIRGLVAAEDASFRSRARFTNLFNWLGRDRYFRAYASQALDAYAELQRFRNAGVEVPTAPPAN